MRRPKIPGWAEEQTPTPFLYHKLNETFLIISCLLGVLSSKKGRVNINSKLYRL